MAPQQQVPVALAIILLSGGVSRVGAQALLSPVQHIDHIMIRADRPGDLYAFLTDILRLPVAWPLAERGGVTSGAVGFGNVNVEAIKFPDQTNEPFSVHLVGFGLKPIVLSESLAELTRRGITYGEPRPFVSAAPDGARMTLFTNVTLRQFSDADRPARATTHIFLSHYNPTYVDVDQRRVRLRNELLSRRGGPIGVTGVKEVIIGTTDLSSATRLWQSLLEPTRALAPGVWQIGDGPAIRLVEAKDDRLQGLVVSALSLRRAIEFLQQAELLGAATATEATIAASKIYGLQIRLVEASDLAPNGAGEPVGCPVQVPESW